MANESWRTAITRRSRTTGDRIFTKPTEALMKTDYMKGLHWGCYTTFPHGKKSFHGHVDCVLDFGAGKSFDATLIKEMHPEIHEATAYDPHARHLSETIATDNVPSRQHYDLVLVNFVLNVQQTKAQAMQVLKEAMSHVHYGGNLWVSTRSVSEIEKNARERNWGPPNSDGAYQSRTIAKTGGSTWQLGFDSSELEDMILQAGMGFEIVNMQGEINLGRDTGWVFAINLNSD
jgi:hypothetical protein